MRKINIGWFEAHDIENNSAVTMNQSEQVRIFVRTKRNQGFGENNADGCVLKAFNGVDDQDLLDSGAVAFSRMTKKRGG